MLLDRAAAPTGEGIVSVAASCKCCQHVPHAVCAREQCLTPSLQIRAQCTMSHGEWIPGSEMALHMPKLCWNRCRRLLRQSCCTLAVKNGGCQQHYLSHLHLSFSWSGHDRPGDGGDCSSPWQCLARPWLCTVAFVLAWSKFRVTVCFVVMHIARYVYNSLCSTGHICSSPDSRLLKQNIHLDVA